MITLVATRLNADGRSEFRVEAPGLVPLVSEDAETITTALEELGVDIHALRLNIGLFGRTGDVHLHRDADFGMKRNTKIVITY